MTGSALAAGGPSLLRIVPLVVILSSLIGRGDTTLSEASVQCPGEVGGPVISGNSRVSGTHAHLILNATFPCEGKVSAWICQVTDRAAAIFVDVWRRVAADPDNYFTLVGKNRIPPGYMGRHVFRIKNRYQISVQRGDFIGYHYSMQSVSKEGALAMSHGNDNVTASGNDHQTITAGLYDENFLVHTPINFNTNDKKLRYQRHALEAMVEYGQDSGTPEPTLMRNRHVCEGEEVELFCPEDTTLLVRRARYGMTVRACGRSSRETRACTRAVWHVVHTRCTGKRRCSFRVTPSLFGDPCPNARQTLEIQYTCVGSKKVQDDVHAQGIAQKKDQTLSTMSFSRLVSPSVTIPGRPTSKMLSSTGTTTLQGKPIPFGMPTVFSEPQEQHGAVVGGSLFGAVALGTLLALFVFIYRRYRRNKQRKIHLVQSRLLNQHMRLNPLYLSKPELDACRAVEDNDTIKQFHLITSLKEGSFIPTFFQKMRRVKSEKGNELPKPSTASVDILKDTCAHISQHIAHERADKQVIIVAPYEVVDQVFPPIGPKDNGEADDSSRSKSLSLGTMNGDISRDTDAGFSDSEWSYESLHGTDDLEIVENDLYQGPHQERN